MMLDLPDDLEFRVLNPFETHNYRQQVYPLIQEVLEKTRCRKWDIDYVWGLILQGILHLWIVVTPEDKVVGFSTTETVSFPKCTLCCVFMAAVADEYKHILSLPDLLASHEEWAQANGYDGMQVSGRLGWKKLWQDMNYRDEILYMTKVFDNERLH